MTLTRERIEELTALLRDIRPNYGDVGTRDVDVARQQKQIDRAIDLLALAERALEPQGKALPELPKPAGWARWVDRRLEFSVGAEKPFCNERGSGYFTPWAMMFDGKTTQDYGQQCYDAGRASQLALPAGPAPEDSELLAAFNSADTVIDGLHEVIKIAVASPAVAQPVADEREALTDAEIMDIARECEDEYCFPINHKQFARKLLARAALCQPAEEGGKS